MPGETLNPKTKKSLLSQTFLEGGGKRIRTADPLHAMQVLYQLSYTPLDGIQCNTPLNIMSRIKKPSSSIFFIFICQLLFLSGCQSKSEPKTMSSEHVFSLANVHKNMTAPPFSRDAYSPSQTINYSVLASIKTYDKHQQSHQHHYLHSQNPLTTHDIETLIISSEASYHWFYISADPQVLKQPIHPAMFSHLAYCRTAPNAPEARLHFDVAYTYEDKALHCAFSYVP